MDIQFDMPKNRSNVIKVIGVGGGGSNAINHMFQLGIDGVDFVVSNTDAQALQNSPVPTKVQLGVNLTEGLGAGANPEIGEQAALESFEDLKTLLDTNTKMVFITAGMGGGTGTGAAPIIAKQARDMEILTVGIVTIPFKFEGRARNEQAKAGVEKLRRNVDSLIVIDNNKLREVYGNLGFKSGFSKADEVLATAARGIAEVITHHYTQNIDLRDARTVLSNSGTAIMGSAKATGGNRAQEAIGKAIDSPLLNDNKIKGAKNVLLLIVSGNEEITLDEIGEINDHIQSEAGHSANIIMGVGEDEDLGESISVTIIATGFDPDQQNEIINTESKKIIHTLENEQKAVQDLSPDNTSISTTRKAPLGEEPRRKKAEPRKIVHELEELNQDNPKEELQSDEKSTDASEIIRELEVDYQEIKFDEDDFVFIEERHDKSEDAQKEIEASEEEEEFMFEFNMPKRKEKSSEQNADRRNSPSDTARPNTSAQTQTTRHRDQVRLFPEDDADRSEKRYSLADYMEKEKELTQAKPKQKKEINPEEDQLQFVKKEKLRQNPKPEETQPTEAPEGEIDPLNSPISDELAARASERRARLKKFNYQFKKSNNIDEIEKQPAYKRAGVDLDNDHQSTDSNLSRSTIDEENKEGGGPHLRSNNSFLHDNVD